jgi:hypothetical protein
MWCRKRQRILGVCELSREGDSVMHALFPLQPSDTFSLLDFDVRCTGEKGKGK